MIMRGEPWKIKCHICGNTFVDEKVFARHVEEERKAGLRAPNNNLAWVKQNWSKIPLLDMEAEGN